MVVTLTIATLLMATARPAMAHATLLSTTPTGDELLPRGPDAIELRFDEPVEVLDGAIRVFGPTGDRVDRGQVEVDGPVLRARVDRAARGTYTVTRSVTMNADQASELEGPDDDGIDAGGLLAAGFLALVVGGCAVGFARSVRRTRAGR